MAKKFNLKKTLLMVTAYALVAALAIGGTVAYLQDSDSDVNVMTLGNVSIEQIEQERDENGNLVPFSQAKPAYPAVGKIAWDDTFLNVNGTGYKVFDDGLKNVVDKIVTVNNTGKSDAYVRTIVAIEAPEGDPNDLIHFNWNDTGVELEGGFVTKIDGVDYYIVSFVYTDALAAGTKSAPSLMQLFLDSKATNEDCAKFGPSWEILVKTQAVQAEGFADAKTALDTAFGTITAAGHPWSNTVLVQTNDEAELKNALTSGKEVILNTDIVNLTDAAYNGNGSKVQLAGSGTGSYGYLGFNPGKGEDVAVSNLTVNGVGFVEVGHYGEGGGNYTINDLTINGMSATLAVNNGYKEVNDKVTAAFAHYGNATLNNCVMTGTVATTEGYTAEDTYDAGFVNSTKTIINGGKYGSIYVWNHANVTIKNADLGTITTAAIKLKNGNGKLTIGEGTTVDTIIISDVAAKYFTPNLVIEDGATVGAIVYNGTTYTQAEWLARG